MCCGSDGTWLAAHCRYKNVSVIPNPFINEAATRPRMTLHKRQPVLSFPLLRIGFLQVTVESIVRAVAKIYQEKAPTTAAAPMTEGTDRMFVIQYRVAPKASGIVNVRPRVATDALVKTTARRDIRQDVIKEAPDKDQPHNNKGHVALSRESPHSEWRKDNHIDETNIAEQALHAVQFFIPRTQKSNLYSIGPKCQCSNDCQ
jgi:hypothetical protein